MTRIHCSIFLRKLLDFDDNDSIIVEIEQKEAESPESLELFILLLEDILEAQDRINEEPQRASSWKQAVTEMKERLKKFPDTILNEALSIFSCADSTDFDSLTCGRSKSVYDSSELGYGFGQDDSSGFGDLDDYRKRDKNLKIKRKMYSN